MKNSSRRINKIVHALQLAAITDQRRVFVVPREKGWAVRKEGAHRAIRTFNKKTQAVNFAKKMISKEEASEMIVHDGLSFK